MSEPLSPEAPAGSSWIVIESFSEVGQPADPPTDRTVEVAANVAGDDLSLYMHDLTATDLERAQLPVHALVQATSAYDPYVVQSFTVEDGEVLFLGECGTRAAEVVNATAVRLGIDAAALIEEFVRLGPASQLGSELGRT